MSLTVRVLGTQPPVCMSLNEECFVYFVLSVHSDTIKIALSKISNRGNLAKEQFQIRIRFHTEL